MNANDFQSSSSDMALYGNHFSSSSNNSQLSSSSNSQLNRGIPVVDSSLFGASSLAFNSSNNQVHGNTSIETSSSNGVINNNTQMHVNPSVVNFPLYQSSNYSPNNSNVQLYNNTGIHNMPSYGTVNFSLNNSSNQLYSNISVVNLPSYGASDFSFNSNNTQLYSNMSAENVSSYATGNVSSNNQAHNEMSVEDVSSYGTSNFPHNNHNTEIQSHASAESGQSSSGDAPLYGASPPSTSSLDMSPPQKNNSPKEIAEIVSHKLESLTVENNIVVKNDPDAMAECSTNWRDLQKHDIRSKLLSENYNHSLVVNMLAKSFTVEYVQRNGLYPAMFFKDFQGLGMRVLPKLMKDKINLIEKLVGSEEFLDVVDHDTNEMVDMTIKEWITYYQSAEKQKKLYVVGFEISGSELEPYIVAPDVVRKLDWVNCVWPYFLKEMETELTPTFDEMKYPKVQKFCHMSVEGCFIDFHILRGGAASWLGVSEGALAVWLVCPSSTNLKLYKDWMPCSYTNNIFFGDVVKQCQRITVEAGMALIIPEGWIVARYSMKDTIAFEGYFLHSYGIPMHIRIALMEEDFAFPDVMQFPLFTDMMVYALERYSHCLLGKSHLEIPPELRRDVKSLEVSTNRQYLCESELTGIQYIVHYLNHLPTVKRKIPRYISDFLEVLKAIKHIVANHRYDDQDKAITGKVIPRWSDNDDIKPPQRVPLTTAAVSQVKAFQLKKRPVGATRTRRVRCHKCETCLGEDCQKCTYCLDMPKYGGQGKMRQSCAKRRCMNPVISGQAVCGICDPGGKTKPGDKSTESRHDLLQCIECFAITHMQCAIKKFGDSKWKMNETLQNSWLCPGCYKK